MVSPPHRSACQGFGPHHGGRGVILLLTPVLPLTYSHSLVGRHSSLRSSGPSLASQSKSSLTLSLSQDTDTL